MKWLGEFLNEAVRLAPGTDEWASPMAGLPPGQVETFLKTQLNADPELKKEKEDAEETCFECTAD